MKIKFVQNTMYNGDRVLAGKELELSDDAAKLYIAAKLAVACEKSADQTADDKQPAKKSGGKKGK